MKTKLLFGMIKIIMIVGLSFVFSNANGQITSWTFDPFLGTVNNPTPNTGSGTASIVNLGGATVPGSATGMTLTGCGVQTSGNAWALNPFDPGAINESTGVQFKSTTVGYQNVFFTWDQRWSTTAPNTVRLQYTTDGTTWVPFTMTAGNTTFCSGSINSNGCFEINTTGDQYRRIIVNFTAIVAANNNPNFGIRLLASYYRATTEFRQTNVPATVAGASGTWRFDNVAFTGTAITSTAAVISGTATVCAGGSTNLQVAITGGVGPFTLTYQYTPGPISVVVNNYNSGDLIPVTPPVSRQYTIVSVTGVTGGIGTGNSGNPIVTVLALPAAPTAGNLTTCTVGSFTMTGGSLPPPSWTGSYSTGNPYSGGTTTFTYIITRPYPGCTRTSPGYTFTRRVAPAITTQPTGTQTVCLGTATFNPISVVATGTGLAYTWYSNTTNSNVGGTLISGATSASYTPPSLAVSPDTYYYVEVSGTCSPLALSNTAGPYKVLAAAVGGSVLPLTQTISCGATPADLTVSGFTNTVVKWQYATDFAFTTPIDIATTLTTLPVGAIPATRYYRAVIDNSTCLAYSNVVTITLAGATTWNGSAWSTGSPPDSSTPAIFAGDYNSTGDLSACSVQINSGNVVFGNAVTNPSHTLEIQNGLSIIGGSLTFENNASLVQVNNSTNTGNITYKRKTSIRKYDYTYWSSPVSLITLANLSPRTLSDKYLRWNAATYVWDYLGNNTTMTPGLGYAIRGPQLQNDLVTPWPLTPLSWDGVFTGIPNNGDIGTSPDNDLYINTPGNDLNMIGNPYPSAISARKLMDGNPGVLGLLGAGTTIYIWTHNSAIGSITPYQYNAADMASLNRTGGTIAGSGGVVPTDNIAAGQGFLIQAVTPGTITFRNAMRVGNPNNIFFRTNQQDIERNRVWLDFTSQEGAFKQILVGYIENATDGFDYGFDGKYLDTGNAVSFYSLINNQKMVIQGKALPFNDSDATPLGYKADLVTQYTISLSNFDGLFESQDIYLEDTLLNVIHDLKASPYIFMSDVGVFDTRFILRFTTPSLGISESNFNSNSIIIYKNLDQKVTVNSSVKKMKSIKVFDVLGRLLLSKENINSNEITLKELTSNNVLLMSIELDDNQIISKKFSN